ncbi:ammonium transporter AmtB-like domain-containing protein [Gilbertella persicaria]|uniref:ammonium transporter AmtB-like domain-containing protein n=1 Tax=Gilbertella persicaria TaxID=101096 RepID=UPI002220FA58|nr:ammonium transporter AmtB-like domain-containing protein [Gilbertella persicaria]KAI8080672.1 ammonium transporter AmtB-like domain-containing protein [Gilbertella persicaria]
MADNSTLAASDGANQGVSYTINAGDTAWVMICACLVFIMSPALGLFYAGLARAKNALSLMYLTVLSVAVVSFQWYLIGYSLTFSQTGSRFIGDSAHFLLRGVGIQPAAEGQSIPASAFMIFQAMFAAITPALAFGSAAERMSLGPAILFIFVWTTLVYDVITNWVWASNGWLLQLGVMDYAGGIPVHISSGLGAFAYALVLGKRRDYHENVNAPHNVTFVFLGLALMWFGWFAFNAGSALAANARSVNSLVATHISACTAAIVWVLLDYIKTRKWSIIGLCTGAVAGLATITPGSGFITPSSSLAFGAIGSFVCYIAIHYKHKMGIDDCLDVFGVHYVGGLVGLILTGIFAQRSVIALSYPEGTPWDTIPIGGWLDGNWKQVPIQLAGIAAVSAWSFVVTYIILMVINQVPSLYLRLADEDEVVGTDWAEMGERAYGYLPFEEAGTSMSAQTAPANLNGSIRKQNIHMTRLRKLFMVDRSAVIRGVPNLIEEPVLDYSQQKDLGVYHLNTLQQPTMDHKPSAQLKEVNELVTNQPHVLQHTSSNDDTIQVISASQTPVGSSSNSQQSRENA